MTNKPQIPSLLQLTQFTMDRAADAIFWVGKNGSLMYGNDAACQSLGYSHDELLSLSVFDIDPNFPAEGWPKYWKELRKAKSLSFESSHRARDGRIFPVEITAKYIKFKDQEYNCAFVRDITNRKRIEQELGLMQTAIDKSRSSFYRLSSTGMVMYVNDYACASLGYTRDEMIGRYVWSFDPDFPPEAWPSMWERLKRTGGIYIESRHRRKDGTIFPVEVRGNYISTDGEEYSFTFVQDISERKEAEEQLRLAYATINMSKNAFYWVSPEGQVQYANDFACKSLGYSREELVGLYIWDFDPDFPASAWPSVWKEIKEKGAFNAESRHRRKDGTIFPIEVAANYIISDGIEYDFVSVLDITERKEADLNIHNLAYFDALTGLPNRTLLHDRMDQLLAWSTRDHKEFSVLFLDLDRFKGINDSMGHTMGDKLLQGVANRLKLCVRDGDTVARIGGDEFIVLLRDTSADGAARVAHNMLRSIEVTYNIDGQHIFTHASIGISTYPANAADVEKLIKYADIAMYRAKEEGRNNFQFFAAEMNLRSDLLFSMEKDLRFALERNEFSLHYQAQADLTSGKVCGVEALLRWKHPEKGFIPPTEFISVAEDTGQILPIGEWVLRTACRQLAEWRQQGMTVFPLAINLSIRQVRQPALASMITAIIKEAGLQPSDLELEITEGIMMSHVKPAMIFLEQMSKLGVQLSIDDFGTGFSSLSYLKKLPVNRLKIDQSFVRDIEEDESDDAIVRSIIGLGHQYQLKVIAEGVETKEQLDFLRVNGCDEIQGYYFSPPLPADEFMKFISGNPMLEMTLSTLK